MLPKPPHIAAAQIADSRATYPWDEWNVVETYSPGDPDLVDRLARLSFRANVALTTATLEWIVWRFEALSTDTTPHEYVEAAWAAGVHNAYAIYSEFEDDDWRGVIRGPLRIGMAISVDLIWGLESVTPGQNAAYMLKLAQLVLTDPEPMQSWHAACVARLEALYPLPAKNAEVLFSDEIDIGPWVPRELFDLSRPFDLAETRTDIARFVRSLSPDTNQFLNTPEEMLEFPDYHGTPYTITDADS